MLKNKKLGVFTVEAVKMGYLICKKCGGYYELQQGESPDDPQNLRFWDQENKVFYSFDECECGGELEYVENLNDAFEEPNHQKIGVCSRCGAENDNTSAFCLECGSMLRHTKFANKNSTWKRQSTGVKLLIILGIVALSYFLIFPIALTSYIFYQEGLSDNLQTNGLSNAKQVALNEVNSYFIGALAGDPVAKDIRSEINSAKTPREIDAINVQLQARLEWMTYQTKQIDHKGSSGTVRVIYTSTDGRKNVLMKVPDAVRLVNELDASALSKMVIKSP